MAVHYIEEGEEEGVIDRRRRAICLSVCSDTPVYTAVCTAAAVSAVEEVIGTTTGTAKC